jgi:predicted amidophosphoribosyltransferase
VQSLIDLLLPPRCSICGRSGPLVCSRCLLAMPLLDGPVCARCGAPTDRPLPVCAHCRDHRLGCATARAALDHRDGGRVLVHRLKGGALRALAGPAAGLVAIVVPRPQADAITWVPGDRLRTLRRGGHPPEQLARALSERWGIEPLPLLRARGRRRPQRGLDHAARRRNVRDAFAASGEPPPSVVLVDDVLTTGATIAACGRALRTAGAERVHAVTLARVVALGP